MSLDETAAYLEALGVEIAKLVTWWGTALETMPPAEDVLDAAQDYEFPSDDEAVLVAFYHGAQWPEDVAKARAEANRPVLVVNRLPELVATAMARRAHPNINEHRLLLILTRQNRDAQMAYNYLVTSAVEAAMRRSVAMRERT